MDQQTYTAQVVRRPNADELAAWYEKRGLSPDENGIFSELPYRGEDPAVEREQILENVRINAARRDVPNLAPREYTPRTLVYVGGGTTLQQFLDDVKRKCEDDNYDVLCSNKTGKWLLSKGIKPNYHFILDPQQKKLKDLDYEENVDLMLGIQCHPDLFDFAKQRGRKVQKFLALSVNAVDGELSDRELARAAVWEGDPQLLGFGGGSMCGTRMLYFAGARGYRRLEYYGFDGHVTVENNVLRCYSYQKARGENILEIECEDGRKFFSTMALGRQAEELVTMYKEYPGLDIVIYGDSLLAHTLKLYNERVRNELSARWTDDYATMMRAYMANGGMGILGAQSAPRVFMAAMQLKKKHGSCAVLDYGGGHGLLIPAITKAFPDVDGVTYHEYDPFVAGKDAEPAPADLIFCGDVMEHVEPQCVDAVFKHIAGLTRQIVIFQISLIHAAKTLPDGRNAHLCVKKPDWWLSYIRKHFMVVESQRESELLVVAQRLP